MEIEVIRGTTAGDFRPLAEFYLNQILSMTENGKYKDPAIEAEFQEWKAERERKKKHAAVKAEFFKPGAAQMCGPVNSC